MAVSKDFIEFLVDGFEPLGTISARGMFGGAGLYCDGVMFALVAYDTLYLKADDETAQAFLDEGLEPFTYEGKAKPVRMSYWRAPERVFDDPDEMQAWGHTAVQVAKKLAARKKAKPRRGTATRKQERTTKSKRAPAGRRGGR